MRKHQYRVTLEHLGTDGTATDNAPLCFTARCHDDIVAIVERARARGTLSADDAATMVVGLKLLGEIALENRNTPLFGQLSQDLGAFIKKLKAEN